MLKRHTDSPTAGEWRDMEVTAKRLYPDYRWVRPFSLTQHFYLHAVEWGAPCNRDHAA